MIWPQDLDAENASQKSGLNEKEGIDQPDTITGKFNAAAFEQRAKSQQQQQQQQNDPSKPSRSRISQSRELDPLDWKFTGIFGEDCPLYRLHGKVPQHYRKQVYKDFCQSTRGVLLCTDVAARGLDLPAVNWILQYDPPCETSDYVHRVGRTARKGLAGQALTMLLPSETLYISLLASHGLTLSPMSSQSMFMQTSKDIPGAKKFKNIDEMVAVILQRRAENVVAHNKLLTDAATQAFRSFVRAYATHSADTKGIFKVQALHLGHVAKCFALRERPKELAGRESGGDVIGRIFNGEFASKAKLQAMKKEAVERERKAAEKKLLKQQHLLENEAKGVADETVRKKKATRNVETFSDDSDNNSDDDDDDDDESEAEENVDGIDEADSAGEGNDNDNDFMESTNEIVTNPQNNEVGQDDQVPDGSLNKNKKALRNAAKSLQSAKQASANKTPQSNGRTWTTSRAESVLGKRKLSFGKQSVKLSASGKFRKSGGYFRKKLRAQMSSEFAN